MDSLYKQIPQVNTLIEQSHFKKLISKYGHECVVDVCREELDNIRRDISQGNIDNTSLKDKLDNLPATVRNKLSDIFLPSPCAVINATGTILHTNLGRSPLSKWQLSGILDLTDSYCDLEYNMQTGKRGSRLDHINSLLCNIVGSEANVIVNNNAAAVLLVLCSLGAGSEVIISRGELVEIGGKFRIPDVLAQSGCKLVEVGTTNKTRLEDYEAAITEKTAAIIKVHTSNFKVIGFTESVDTVALCELCKKHDVLMIEDLGSGLLVDLAEYGLGSEPTVQQSLKSGVDLVCYSADKLLGGPQAGIISGRESLVEKIKSNQLMRALRVGKLELSVLRQTLLLYMDKQNAVEQVPILQMITSSCKDQKKKADYIIDNLQAYMDYISIAETKSCIGGGSMPSVTLDSIGIAISVKCSSADEICEILRLNKAHVIARIVDDQVILDLRTVFDSQLDLLVEALREMLDKLVGENLSGKRSKVNNA